MEESDPIVHPSMKRASTNVKRVGNIPIFTPFKAFGNAEKSEKFDAKLAWSNRTAM